MDPLSGGREPAGPGRGRARDDRDVTFPGTDRELRSAVALAAQSAVPDQRLREVLDRVGSAAAVVEENAGQAAWRVHLGRGERRALRELRPASGERLADLRGEGRRLVSYRGPGYPERLLHLHQPPPVLHLAGPGELDRPSVAVVGTRSATSYGRRAARDLAGGLARAGWTVVSGLARGVDAAAHRAALDAGGRTAAVLGSGMEHRYPASNRELYRRIEGHGLLVSEFPPEQAPRRWTFPKRNRIIAALSSGVVVVQAPRRSGALITAEQALELGREVFAVPGPVGSPASEGTHDLLRSGAPLAARAADVLEVLEDRPRAPQRELELEVEVTSSVDAEGGRSVWEALQRGAETLEELRESSRLPAGRLLAVLAELELAGRVRALPGDRYRPVRTGGG